MTTSDMAAALAKALPAGITYDIAEDNHYWLDTKEIAAFQAERLAESGYRLVRPVDEAEDDWSPDDTRWYTTGSGDES